MRALVTTYVLIVLVIIYANFNANAVFNLLNIIGSMVIVVWGSSIWSQIRLRRAIKRQGKNPNELLPYKSTILSSWSNYSDYYIVIFTIR